MQCCPPESIFSSEKCWEYKFSNKDITSEIFPKDISERKLLFSSMVFELWKTENHIKRRE